MSLLEIENLQTYFHIDGQVARAVDGVSFSVAEGESLALVGESACGKSVTALSIMGLIRPPGFHPGGSIRFDGTELLGADERVWRSVRGNKISMIFQEPMTSLNPVYTIANQLAEPLTLHQGMNRSQAYARCRDLLGELGISEPDVVLGSYPHQLSGGMCQRVMIAMAIACKPRLMIADEPSTALDVTVQAQILHMLKELQREFGMSLLLITHDLGVVNQMSDRIFVMYSGQEAETGSREDVLHHPAHPYTVKLLESIPRGVNREQHLSVIQGQVRQATDYPEGCRFADRCGHAAPRCEVRPPPLYDAPSGSRVACFLADPDDPLPRAEISQPAPARHLDSGKKGETLLELKNLTTHFPIRKGFFKRIAGYVRAVDGVSLAVREGTTLGLVGESGCGKTTLGHSLLSLVTHARGEVKFENVNLLTLPPREMRAMRKKVQIIFQDPFGSLNPRLNVKEIVGEGLRVHEPKLTASQFETRVAETLEEVGLSAGVGYRYPHEFSGGQRQRIALARALILRPRFIVLDEATSALDVSVQAQILNLLRELQARHNLTYLFITHDLSVVEYLADEVAVMYLGRIVESGPTGEVFRNPAHPYTRALLEAVPSLDTRWQEAPALSGDVPSPVNPPQGCHFHPRCPVFRAKTDPSLTDRCPKSYPEAVRQSPTHWARCFAAEGEVVSAG
ncbi:MAG: dipeptide ABC transporter ATP-binding protein [SAR324 cluster bacterium]|nr:dipeptide ABC transporter ATP-binding protein [SAR324 cluster bacterium]